MSPAEAKVYLAQGFERDGLTGMAGYPQGRDATMQWHSEGVLVVLPITENR